MNTIIIFSAQYLYLIITIVGIVSFIIDHKKIHFLTCSALTLILSFLIGKFLNGIIQSPRPIFTDYIQPLIPTAIDNGFPSDHTLLSMTVALIVFSRNKIVGSILIVLAICVGTTRVITHSHHIIDVVGSIAISLASILVVAFIPKLSNKMRKHV